MAKQKKKKKNRSLNLNKTTDENKVESDSESSSQEEDSTKTTLTSKRKPTTISPPENQPKSKIINCTTTPKAASNNSTSTNDSERLIVDESNQTNEELNSTELSNTDNATKDLRYDTNTSFNDLTTHPNEELDDEPKTIETYTLQLPSVRDAMEPTETQETKEERIARKGKYAMAVLNSPLGSSTHTKEKELQHSTKEHGKTLYGSYEIVEGNDSFSSLDLLKVIVNHIDQKNIEAFYKTVEGKFIVVLVNSGLKEAFPPELNFQEKIQNTKVNFRLVHETRKRGFRQGMDDTVFVTMFLPTLISDAAVKKAFSEFGQVHHVFPGRYKKTPFSSIRNGKRHIRMTPSGSKHDLPHQIRFKEEDRHYHVFWAQKVIFCKRCSTHHELSYKCEGDHHKEIYTENGITYDTRPAFIDKPVAEPVSSGHSGTIQGAPKMGCSSNGPEEPRIHTDATNNMDQPISEIERLARDEVHKELSQRAWDEIPNEDTPTSGEPISVAGGKTDCPGSSKPAEVTPTVSTNSDETERHISGLNNASTVDLPTREATQVSRPNLAPDKALETTVETVDTKTQFRKEDVGPS